MARRYRPSFRYGVALAATALAVTFNPVPASGQTTPPAPADVLTARSGGTVGTYVVTLTEKPLATYEGGVAGIAATRAAKGGKVDVGSPAARRYRDHLTSRHREVARNVGAQARRSNYVVSNSFVADLTPAQAARLQLSGDVLSVSPNKVYTTTDDRNSVDFLKLSGRDGVWSKVGGTAEAGKGVVVGVLDTGIWPENPSFAAPALGTTAPTTADPYRPYREGSATVMRKADGGTFRGTCQTGEEFTASACNEKIISARYFGEGWKQAVPPEERADYESPRDAHGHGTHTAGTAAGNTAVPVRERGIDFGAISGVAPGAAIAVYKVLWNDTDGGGRGTTVDIVAAVDQAVADGVDVINYSIGSSSESSPGDAAKLAFLNAASAGIFISSAAGNSGPSSSSLDNTTPWEMTVGASTIASYSASVKLGDGTLVNGTSTTVATTFGPKPLIASRAAKAGGATDADADYCAPGTLDPAKVTGKVVVCLRGIIGRTAKSAEVARAGGVGMVLGNPSVQDLSGDLHGLPTVHVNAPDTQTVLDYAATPGAQVTLLPTGNDQPYPQVAAFSSRGPSLKNQDLLKPDLTAPGVGILAAVSPRGEGKNFDFYSGTSMATPHVAGLAAIYLAERPTATPAEIKSALMTTTYATRTTTGAPNTDVWAQGTGHVDPTRMLNPGVVYDASAADWLGYLEGKGYRTGSGVAPIAGSDLNYPSIRVENLFGTRTVTRRVTAVTPGVYTAKVDLPGVKVKVTPSTLRFRSAGETREFTVTMQLTSATGPDTIRGGLTWTGAGTTARSPIVVTPHTATAPEQVQGSGAKGSLSFEVTPGLAKFPIKAYGMVAGRPASDTVTPEDIWGKEYEVSLGTGTKAAEVTVRTDDPRAQLGVVIYRVVEGVAELADLSDYPAAEQRFVLKPAAEPYRVAVVVWGDMAPGTTATPYTVQANVVTDKGGVGNLTVSPKNPRATPGTPLTVTTTWSGLPGGRHTGYIEYAGGTGTVVSVN
ncbi:MULTISPECIES: S8 family serine peptidase [Micromonospora]|uniref:S8 family serine peptidase n=1 Tax=Micromonospora TaxID=1873 RepID=UPI002905BFC4|nr:S8 family serine peptidase [Micromonospora sp. Mcm103]